MNARAQHATTAKADEAGPRRRAKLKVVGEGGARDHRMDQAAETEHLTAEKLRAWAAHPLPHRAALEPLFGRDLSGVETRQGSEVDRQLDASGAEAATSGRVLLLREGAPLPVVAHEVAHLLQSEIPGPRALQAAVEGEAMRAESAAAEGRAIPAPKAALAPDATAFRASGVQVAPAPDPAARDTFRETTAPTPQTEAPAAAPAATQGNANVATDAAPDAPPLQSPTAGEALGPAAPAAPEVSAETLAAAGGAREQAEAAIANAEDADAVLAAMAAAPPSVKARQAGGIGAAMEVAQAAEQQNFNASLPTLSAKMSGTDAAPPPTELTTPAAPAATEEPTPAPAPLPEVDPTPDPGPASFSASAATLAFVPGDPEALGDAFRALPAEDSAVETSAGTRPTVPQEGDTDPARAAAKAEASGAQAEEARAAATQAVIDGPGPEQAQLQSLHEELPAPTPMAPALVPPPATEGATAFAAMPLDAETTALFDQAHGPTMATSFQGAEAEMQAATETRDQGRDEQVQTAEAETQRLNAEADAAQQAEVTARREEIQTARQDAVDGQAEAVADLNQTASTERQSAETEIAAETTRTDAAVAESFTQAETEAEAEVARGTKEAETTRQSAEHDAEGQSWWDRATDWIASQFQRLAAAITTIFNAVRSAVRGIIDAVKTAALALIDLAARAIHALIDVYAALLRGLVDALLSAIFPELAARLRAAIDAAVDLAHRAVDVIATGLKAAVTMALDALAAGLDAVLASWAAALNVVLTLVQAALSGDWRALARLILTPILMALGISPDGFFTLMGRAESALDTIVNSPQVFVANLIESVKGGVGLFADNFLHHLVAGIILWLTGPLGSAIQMPAQFDLWGLLDIARQLAGLTLAMLRRVAVRVIGAEAVARIEFVMNYVGAAIRDGWRGLWTQLTQDLGQLRDMVLDQIKTFLLEKVVMAAITWLASMFNPVGALVKLVMTIWNFITFLRQQVARVYPIVELVINSIADIASGALDGPKRGVERILGRMVPIVIDLLMSLLGVTGVPDRVQTILRGVQERVETATEALMRRVLALFGVQGAGSAAAAPGQIMAPIAFTAGGEAHTILIEDEGETVRPIIRSTPTPLLTWLDGRMAQPFSDLATSKGWTGEALATKRAEGQRLVDAAKAAETQLDTSAEAAENAINAAAASTATDAQKAAATTAQTDTATKGQSTKSAITQVLEFWGIAVQPLAEKYRSDVDRLSAPVKAAVSGELFPTLDPAGYAPLGWPEFREQMQTDGAAPMSWRNPASSGGVAARMAGFNLTFLNRARQVVNDMEPEAKANFLARFEANEEKAAAFATPHLAERLNATTARAAVLSHLLSNPASGAMSLAALSGLTAPIRGAIEDALRAGGAETHDQAFNRVTGNWYKNVLVNQFLTEMGNASWGNYFHDDTENGAGSGRGVPHNMAFFLQPDPTGNAGSRRAQKNRERLADAVRGAGDHAHEWVASRYASNIVTRAAAELQASGNTSKLEGLTELIQFQNRVRVPTKNVLFDPAPGSGAAKGFNAPIVQIVWKSRAHRESDDWRDTPAASLPRDRKEAFYPADGLQPGDTVGILQGHPGAIYASVRDNAPSLDNVQQTQGHTTWDRSLEGVVSAALGDGVVTTVEMHRLGRDLVAYYNDTVWHGDTNPVGRADRYPEYTTSGGEHLLYGNVKTEFSGRFANNYNILAADEESVESH